MVGRIWQFRCNQGHTGRPCGYVPVKWLPIFDNSEVVWSDWFQKNIGICCGPVSVRRSSWIMTTLVNLNNEWNTMIDEYDIWRLTILLYVDFSTEMVRRHVTSGKGYVQRKYKKYAYDEFDIWFSTRIQSIINVICGKSVEFCDYKYHYFRSISNKLSAAWEKKNEWITDWEFSFFSWWCLYLRELWVPHYMQASCWL